VSDFELVRPSAAVADGKYSVHCAACAEKFDASSASWCSCAGKLATLKCPHCAACFCQAPFSYKQKFWSDAPKALRENSRRFRIYTTADVVSPTEAAPVPSSGVRPHVLIVDDEEPIRSLAACYVEQMGYRVTTVSSPEDALLLTDAVSFDAILTDALMPRMDGRELCRQLKQKHGNGIKVILMTSLYTARHFQTEARHVYKVDEYLPKPLRYDDLRNALQRVAPIARRLKEPEGALAL
jgi:CheY-like chemotaxis protein